MAQITDERSYVAPQIERREPLGTPLIGFSSGGPA
jgi:hypothetical protein